MGFERKPTRGRTGPTQSPIRRPSGPVRVPDRFGPGTSDEIGHSPDHSNFEAAQMVAARGTATKGGAAEGTTRGGDGPTTRGDTFGPGTSDEIGHGPDLPGFLGEYTRFA